MRIRAIVAKNLSKSCHSLAGNHHRIIEGFGSEGTFKDYLVPTMGRDIFNKIRLLRDPSSCTQTPGSALFVIAVTRLV